MAGVSPQDNSLCLHVRVDGVEGGGQYSSGHVFEWSPVACAEDRFLRKGEMSQTACNYLRLTTIFLSPLLCCVPYSQGS